MAITPSQPDGIKLKKKWFLYDPNFKIGEKRFDSSMALTEFLQENYGRTLSISISSWKKPEENAHIKQIADHIDEFYSKKIHRHYSTTMEWIY